MDLKHLLSIVTAALTALAAILYSIGAQHSWLAVALWMTAISSLVATDFLGALRLPRSAASFAMWVALAVFLPQFLLHPSWEGRLQTVARILICLQCVLLFQEKDARTFGWLAVMSLLQVVVAARYSRGVVFGSLLIVYTVVGIFALSLLALYGQLGRGERMAADSTAGKRTASRWPLAGMPSDFTGTPTAGGRAGLVPELFARLGLIALGALLLAVVIFYTAPRPHMIPSWRMNESRKEISVVGFNNEIELGRLGETIESREEVMRVSLLDPVGQVPYPMSGEIYLRGATVASYSHNHWRRAPLGSQSGSSGSSISSARAEPETDSWYDAADPDFRIGPAVIQRTTMEPYLKGDDLFYLWPLIETSDLRKQPVHYDRASERLTRQPSLDGDSHPRSLAFDIATSGLVDGRQVEMVPEWRESAAVFSLPSSRFLQMPRGQWALPRLRGLAEQWRRQNGLSASRHYEIARCFERQLSSSGEFHYSLQPVLRDESIDAIEDFVSNNRRGHCEYFATALALMLRSQNIPSRVVLGYRCDERAADGQSYQVRQLHAHAWVEAYLAPEQIPQSRRDENGLRWSRGGWLRLDGTPAAELGTTAANRTAWGAMAARWHGLERYWENYIADMDRPKQQQSIYTPIRRAWEAFSQRFFSPSAWRTMFAGLWTALAGMLGSGMMGKLAVAALAAGVAAALAAVAWWLGRRVLRLVRGLTGGGSRQNGAASSVEFYRRFEHLAARHGLARGAGQTPREFARLAGARLAALVGRPQLSARAVEVAEAFYRVRFGRQPLDAAGSAAMQEALKEFE